MVIYCIKTNIRYSTYKLVAAGHRQNGSPHPESHTETARPLLERDKDRNILKLTAFNRDKYAKKYITAVVKRSEAGSVKRSQPNKVGVFCFRDRMWSLWWRKVGQRLMEKLAVPEFKLCSGGCWVILSFTHALVRVSRSGGTVSMSDSNKRANVVTGRLTQQQEKQKGSICPLLSQFIGQSIKMSKQIPKGAATCDYIHYQIICFLAVWQKLWTHCPRWVCE